ncbi:hypothetical protein J2X60_002960 [Curtobacterium sp. 320]|uniref:hypothetical protein n=1 Tax=Curtobacterium sp. 320 TaxID=2817749 RepID=UPI00286769DE|nr:hypothetical protein [Curtobacterium sp. 320]MDR6574301.1 hypothetical protein [Curtobacterium sp. 320]
MTENDENPAVDEADSSSEEELTADELLEFALTAGFNTFRERQREIRRLARYVQERADDIDNAKTRAKELIEEQLSEVDEKTLDDLMNSFTSTLDEVVQEQGLSDDERVEVVASTFRALSEDLPAGALSSYLESIARVTLSPPPTPMLLGSLLVSLVGELETLVGAVARALYAHQPGKLSELGKSYTWGEIERFETVAEMREHVADHAVEKMLYGSFSDWFDLLERRFGVPRPARSTEFKTLEVIQRRHLMVHSAGVVSRQYLENLKDFKVEADLHDQLVVDYKYLADATDALFVVALSLVAGTTFKSARDVEAQERMERRISNTTYYLLQEERYEAVISIVQHLALNRMRDELAKHIIQVNGWIALKQLGRFAECRKAVERFDTRSKSNNLRLAKMALLDQVEAAHTLAREMLESEELPAEHWLAWPLLADVRAYHEALTLKASEDAQASEGD